MLIRMRAIRIGIGIEDLLDQLLQVKPSNFGLANFYRTVTLVNDFIKEIAYQTLDRYIVLKITLSSLLQAKPSNFGLANFHHTIVLINDFYVRSRLAQALYVSRKRLIS
jgi:hypothetical protein